MWSSKFVDTHSGFLNFSLLLLIRGSLGQVPLFQGSRCHDEGLWSLGGGCRCFEKQLQAATWELGLSSLLNLLLNSVSEVGDVMFLKVAHLK